MKVDHNTPRHPGAKAICAKADGTTFALSLFIGLLLGSCAAPDTQHHIVISTRDQKLALLDCGNLMAVYPVSTSKFGLGDSLRSSRTPVGQMEVAKKIG